MFRQNKRSTFRSLYTLDRNISQKRLPPLLVRLSRIMSFIETHLVYRFGSVASPCLPGILAHLHVQYMEK